MNVISLCTEDVVCFL